MIQRLFLSDEIIHVPEVWKLSEFSSSIRSEGVERLGLVKGSNVFPALLCTV